MVRKWLLPALVLFLLPAETNAQIESPVKWSFAAKRVTPTSYELHMTATIGPGWHLYAQEAGEGPVPTRFKFTKNPMTTTTGKVAEVGKVHKAFDKNFDAELKYYENQVDFVLKVTLKGTAATKQSGQVEFMVCNDHQCLPPKAIDFAISVGEK